MNISSRIGTYQYFILSYPSVIHKWDLFYYWFSSILRRFTECSWFPCIYIKFLPELILIGSSLNHNFLFEYSKNTQTIQNPFTLSHTIFVSEKYQTPNTKTMGIACPNLHMWLGTSFHWLIDWFLYFYWVKLCTFWLINNSKNKWLLSFWAIRITWMVSERRLRFCGPTNSHNLGYK